MYIMYKTNVSFSYHNEYDDNNNKIKTLYSDGCVETWSYDDKRRVTSHKMVEKGEVTIDEVYEYKDNTEIIYDKINDTSMTKIFDEETNNLLAIVSSDSSKLSDICFTYDENNNVVEEFNSKGIITSYKYDEKGNNTYKKTIIGIEEWTEYNEDNLITYRKNSNGIEERFEYDDQKRLIKYTSSILYNNRELFYDKEGRLKKVIYNGNDVERYLYNSKGNLIEKERPDYKIVYSYDEKGNLIEYKRIVEVS